VLSLEDLLKGVVQVARQMKSGDHLRGLGRMLTGAVGVDAGAISADDLDLGVRC
jgi:hypothetical protein